MVLCREYYYIKLLRQQVSPPNFLSSEDCKVTLSTIDVGVE